MNVPEDLRYADTHEWARLEDDGTLLIGITEHAQEQLGDLVFVETPKIDAQAESQQAIAVVESVKAASDIHAPVAGKIVDTNADLADEPELVNTDPYGKGWLFRLEPEDGTEFERLLDAEAYENYLTELE